MVNNFGFASNCSENTRWNSGRCRSERDRNRETSFHVCDRFHHNRRLCSFVYVLRIFATFSTNGGIFSGFVWFEAKTTVKLTLMTWNKKNVHTHTHTTQIFTNLATSLRINGRTSAKIRSKYDEQLITWIDRSRTGWASFMVVQPKQIHRHMKWETTIFKWVDHLNQ